MSWGKASYGTEQGARLRLDLAGVSPLAVSVNRAARTPGHDVTHLGTLLVFAAALQVGPPKVVVDTLAQRLDNSANHPIGVEVFVSSEKRLNDFILLHAATTLLLSLGTFGTSWAASLPAGGSTCGDSTPNVALPLDNQVSVVEEVTLTLTTPNQVVFTISALPGSAVHVFDNINNLEYQFFISAPGAALDPIQGDEGANSSNRQDRRREAFALRVFQVSDTGGERSLKELASVGRLAPGEEYLEPVSGLLFVPRGTRESFMLTPYSENAHCCVDCGGYMVCGARVSGCGGACAAFWPGDWRVNQ